MRVITLVVGLLSHATAANVLDDYINLRVGSFTSAAQAATDSRYDEITWHIVEIPVAGESEARWLYTESWIKDAEAPYMQRLSRVEQLPDESLLVRRYLVPDAEKFIDAWQMPERFASIDVASLVELAGCELTVVAAGRGRFEGSTAGKNCANRYKNASYAISRNVTTADGMVNWDRGFNVNGDLVWGPASGGYHFRRVDAKNACVQPVRMLVYGEIRDRKQFGAYARAIATSELYPRNGGYYEALTPPVAVFEGTPPATRGVVIARFPCLEAARNFWYSDEYQQQIRPLRVGISDFEVLVLPAPPLPDYLD
ncbi:MAG: CpcT/CpeT family chromophore lyase [Gammaproteobacteria bacterium]|nr:CpcT/CpeT family chromophore lyase [Gammaproteobacteria bacterium]